MALTNFQKYIKIFIDQLQECEDAAQQFANVRSINNATGILLDIAGEIVGVDRLGRSDSEYRTAIKNKILLNRSSGEPETVIQGLRIFANATNISYYEVWPAKINLVFSSVVAPPADLRESLEQIAPAGVKIYLNWINEGEFFGFDGEGGFPAAPNTAGFGEEGVGNEDIGGNLVEEI